MLALKWLLLSVYPQVHCQVALGARAKGAVLTQEG
jgi:hypothetical protein